MALGTLHPAVKATQGHMMPREKRDADSLPPYMKNSSTVALYRSLPEPRSPHPTGHRYIYCSPPPRALH